ncbi:hydantoinase B/oxoprolinase family protein [Nonomuraea ferruginea]
MMVGTHPDTGRMFAVSNNDAVGWGGTPDHDGIGPANHLAQTQARNTPVEVLEARTGMFFERLEMRTDSGGAGRHRGGGGVAARDPVHHAGRVPVGDQEDAVAAMGPDGRAGAGPEPGDRVPRHRP